MCVNVPRGREAWPVTRWQSATAAARISITTRLQVIRGLAQVGGAGLVVAAALFALLPLPTQTVTVLGSSAPMFCGAGTTSDPALLVWHDPARVLTGGTSTGSSTSDEARLGEAECLAAADNRLTTALGLAIAGAVLLLASGWIARRLASSVPGQPGPPAAPSSTQANADA